MRGWREEAFIFPIRWLAGLRALLNKYGILLICDEVMCGWGRTGKLFAFEHGGIVPDILTMAKGLTSSYLRLGAVAVSDPIARHFRENVFWGGLTYNAHPTALACAHAAIEVLVGEGMVENAARMEPIVRGHMERLREKHPLRAARPLLRPVRHPRDPGQERPAHRALPQLAPGDGAAQPLPRRERPRDRHPVGRRDVQSAALHHGSAARGGLRHPRPRPRDHRRGDGVSR